MNSRLRIVAVGLPLLVLVLMVGRAEWHLGHSDTWLVEIDGYDPRDLLRGHYLRIRLRIEPEHSETECRRRDSNCCYCLSPDAEVVDFGTLASFEKMTCELAVERCDKFVRAGPLRELRRFYIPEANRVELEERLREAAREGEAFLSVAIAEDGSPEIRDLYLDGVTIHATSESDD